MRVNNDINLIRLLVCHYDEPTFGVPIEHLAKQIRKYLLEYGLDTIPPHEFNFPVGDNVSYIRLSDYIYSISLIISGHIGVILEVKDSKLLFYKFKTEYYYRVGEYYEFDEESESNYDKEISRQIPIYPKFIV